MYINPICTPNPKLNTQCSFCNKILIEGHNYPFDVCSNSHACCLSCMEYYFFKLSSRCAFCNQHPNRMSIRRIQNGKPVSNYQQNSVAAKWVDHESAFFNYFIFNGNTISHNMKSFSAGVFGSVPLTPYRCSFAVRLNEISPNIQIGVIDENSKHQRFFNYQKLQNLIFYESSGQILNKCQFGKGCPPLNIGEIISVTVNFMKGTLNWSVNGVSRVTVKNDKLRDKTIKFVPFIMIEGQSVVSIVG